jgi:hypothetical protein
MLPAGEGDNINGPTLIRVPDWVTSPLGRYYLYFAHHAGKHIRLAYADSVAGAWTIHKPGVLSLTSVSQFIRRHIASPDVLVDHSGKRLIMYFHGPIVGAKTFTQKTFAATSGDGIDFMPSAAPIGEAYSRVFRHGGYVYCIFGSKNHYVARSHDGLSNFECGPQILFGNERHVAVQKAGDRLRVFYTRKFDAPEQILMGTIDLACDWMEWSIDDSVSILKPEMDYEGANEPIVPSQAGNAKNRENALRDPAIFEEHGRTWLLYAIAGESGLALAELRF